MDKITVLYVVFELYAGGMENGLVNLINNSSNRFRHVICCLNKKGIFSSRIRKTSIIYELNKKHGNDFSLPWKIVKIIKKEKVKIIRAFNEDPYFYSFIPSKVTGRPIIYYNGGRMLPEKKRRILLEKTLGNKANSVIIPSEGLKEYMNSVVGIQNKLMHVIHNGVDLNRFSKKVSILKKKRELNIPEDDLVIGTVGRLVSQKNIPCFLKVAKQLLVLNQKATFLIVGDGKLKNNLLSLATQMGLKHKVSFLGIRNDIEEIYKILDYLLLTSGWEGLSNVLLEAMANGITVISTDVEGVREVIQSGENGFIVGIEDVNGFVEIIRNLDMINRFRIGNNAINKIIKDFSIESMVENYENLYLKLLR